MPRYFFDFQDGDQMTPDDDGTELETRQKARAAAIQLLPEVAKDELRNEEHRRFAVTVREEGQQIIYHASLTFHGKWQI
jgi:hypothetical protein